MKTNYIPKPENTDAIQLSAELNELVEAMAKNVHEVWAESRMSQGWTYGPKRDDEKKQTPCMVEYSELPESEKKFDRDMAVNTLKLVMKLGYDIVKREDTELYEMLMKRIRYSEQEFRCRRCGHPIYKHQVFCDKCGLELNMDW